MLPFARIMTYGNTIAPPDPVEFTDVLQQQYTNAMYLHKPTNTLYGYGSNNLGQLGLGNRSTVSTFTVLAMHCAAFWVGVHGSLMIDLDNRIYYTGSIGAFPDYGAATPVNGYFLTWTDVTASFDKINVHANLIKSVHIGESTRILLHDGRVIACGNNTNAECGSGNKNAIPVLTVMTNMGEVSQLACSLQGTHYLKTNKEAWFCGKDNFGESGGGTSSFVYTNKLIRTNVDYISATYDVTWWFTAGSVYWSGYNNTGQAGNGTTSSTNQLTPVKNSQVTVNISDAFLCPSSMGNASIGTPMAQYPSYVRSGGVNSYGQQGTGNTTLVNSWALFKLTAIPGGYDNVLMASKDWSRTLIVTKDYKLYACGGFNGSGGNLPNGASVVTTLTLMPTQLWQ
ncbi:GTPase regulator [Escherichia phage EJP2]|nr:GTPase regulator [Escherichia phage EJP2]